MRMCDREVAVCEINLLVTVIGMQGYVGNWWFGFFFIFRLVVQ